MNDTIVNVNGGVYNEEHLLYCFVCRFIASFMDNKRIYNRWMDLHSNEMGLLRIKREEDVEEASIDQCVRNPRHLNWEMQFSS